MHIRFWFAAALLAALFGLPSSPALADTPPPSNTSVTMSDTGFTPTTVTIAPSGSVTWINQGTNVHTATSIGGSTLPFDTAGVGPGQSVTIPFAKPGTYYYTSAADCLNGNIIAKFPCAITFAVVVTTSNTPGTAVAAGLTAAQSTATPTPSPTPTATAQPTPQPTATPQIIPLPPLPSVVSINNIGAPYEHVYVVNGQPAY
ncbi:MAG: hypothetical protein JO247_19340, partial [Chloroflexi bacterium]|nr:hypothetical protein [Chloroflexota bacterium]